MKKASLIAGAIALAIATANASAVLLWWEPVAGSTYKLTVRAIAGPLTGKPVMEYYAPTNSARQHDYMLLTPSGWYTVEIVSLTAGAPDGKFRETVPNYWESPYSLAAALRPGPPQGLRIVQ